WLQNDVRIQMRHCGSTRRSAHRRGCAARRLGGLFDIVRCEDGKPAFVIAGLVTTSRVFPLAWPRPAATGAGLRSCAPAKLANPTKTPKRARAARPGCTRFLFSFCFALLSPASRAAPSGAGARPFPVFILELTATSRVVGCGGSPAFLL